MSNSDLYLFPIVALLPLTALMLLMQVNPYHALVIRGIVGAVAALVYAVLGAADVALTEALVGTMLAITLYAVAVRSSLIMRLGVLKDEWMTVENHDDDDASEAEVPLGSDRPPQPLEQLANEFRTMLSAHHMRLELVPYSSPEDLHQALLNQDVHAVCLPREESEASAERPPYCTTTRVYRLYEIMQAELSSVATQLTAIALFELSSAELQTSSISPSQNQTDKKTVNANGKPS